MFCVYALRSTKNKDIYIGSSNYLKRRSKAHNLGKVRSTKPNRPWKLIYYEAYKSKKDAIKRERELKTHTTKNELLKRLK